MTTRHLGSAEYLFKLALLEPSQRGVAPTGVLVVYLDQTSDEKLLFLVGLSLPVVRLSESHDEAHISGPLLCVRVDSRTGERLDRTKIVEEPRLANRKGAIWIFLGLVYSHAA